MASINAVESESENDEDVFGEVGFMFDSAHAKTRRLFRFDRDITVPVRLVDDDPGAVQSGHYVWPAAPALCSYLIHSWQFLPHGKVLELGAGCGLAGLVAAKLPGTTAVIFTDHDPGVLDLIRESIAEHFEGNSAVSDKEEMTTVAPVAPAAAVRLSWGSIGTAEQAALVDGLSSINLQVRAEAGSPGSSDGGDEAGSVEVRVDGVAFDLIVASDVIYSALVVEPLFQTVSGLLAGTAERNDRRADMERKGYHLGARKQQQQRSPQVNHKLFVQPSSVQHAFSAGICSEEVAVFADSTPPPTEASPSSSYPPPHTKANGTTGDSINAAFVERVSPPPRCNTSTYDISSCSNSSNAVPPAAAVFVMCQSFAYDQEVERAIARACAEHGFLREVIWDELPYTRSKGSPSEAGIPGDTAEASETMRSMDADSSSTPREGGGEIAGTQEDSANCDGGHSTVIQRAGTKLQLFWRA